MLTYRIYLILFITPYLIYFNMLKICMYKSSECYFQRIFKHFLNNTSVQKIEKIMWESLKIEMKLA